LPDNYARVVYNIVCGLYKDKGIAGVGI